MVATEKSHKFQKGVVTNPNGRPKGSYAISPLARQINSKMFAEMCDKYSSLSIQELRAKIKDPNTLALECAVMSIIYNSAVKSDQNRLNFILDRTMGKVKEVIEHRTQDSQLDYSKLSDSELETLINLTEKAKVEER